MATGKKIRRKILSKLHESDLRDFIRSAFGSDVYWVEQSVGSSVGSPDAEIKIENERVPVELKVWEKNRNGWRCPVRPSQRRYHLIAARKKLKSALCILMIDKRAAWSYVYLLAGAQCPVVIYPEVNKMILWPIGEIDLRPDQANKMISETLKNKLFWRHIQ